MIDSNSHPFSHRPLRDSAGSIFASPKTAIAQETPVECPDGGLSVLVVEDNDVDFMQVAKNLRYGTRRIVLSHATSLGAALQELGLRRFDVILTDLSLPDSSGLETVKRLRAQCDDVPILVLTGLDDETVEREILQAGAQDFLPKGLAGSSWTRKAIEHAVERQHTVNEMHRVTEALQTSHRLLREQSEMRKQDNQKLERLHQTAHEFLAKASHDIRNPLTVIKEHISIVREGLAGRINYEQAEMLEKALIRADDVNTKLDDLLDSSKLDSGLLDICRQPSHVGELIDSVRTTLAQRAAMRNVELEIQADVDVPLAYCDGQKVCRVLICLAVNAINACRDSGHVRIWVRHDESEQQIRIGVTDDGIGIAAEQRDQLAARFARPGLTTDPDDKFLGLGLSIAARFCRLNLGRLHIESEPDLGSIFWFGLPVAGSVQIFPRWLEMQSAPMKYVQLISFHLNESCTPAEKRDGELLLTYLTENDELLIQASDSQWWLATSSISRSTDTRLKKATDEIARLTKARAANPALDIGIQPRAVWSLETPTAEIDQEYQRLVQHA
ncbi:Phytochrome-like protein cph1 [Stieleria maiorica]|uniref:histidine kinase n=1 Tax=Stieleria maiorica TaxID=2795974 RepID=A0A5B9MBX5_9BACT|nr:hybrid sensor histidine kinase/response regulator [Stieleria maiorica]QEF98508.1 Phytochrome-like protein cph1 [Stieleria maiorica]